MTKFIIKRVLTGLVTIWFIWSLVFVLVRLSGDPIEWMLPDGATEEMEQEQRAALGLDLPLHKQYIKNFTNLVTGD
ncbi:MAG: ABC transporter permease, partial [Lachnospiraceae bacterium]|nr:ABC transporter permease [Lachnospiraceae bacterium]